MKKLKCLFVLLFSLCAWGGNANAAPSINYDTSVVSDLLTTPYSGMIVETFDGALYPGWTLTGNWGIVSGTQPGSHAAPFNNSLMTAADSTRYLTVPFGSTNGSGTASLTFGGASYNYLGLFWGSIDSYNTIEFFSSGSGATPVASYTGDDLTNPANGSQTSPSTNQYVNFLNLPDFDRVDFTSTQFAFEIDNIAVGATPVPVPASMLMLCTGLASLARFRRKLVSR